MFEQILLPTDGSEPADRALNRAIDLAREFEATLHVISVVETIPYQEYPDLAAVREHERDRMEQVLEDARARAEQEGVSVQTELIKEMEPHAVIDDYQKEHDIDLIVMGTHGRSGLERLLLGSTTENTLRTVSIPVLSVPFKQE